MYYILPMENQHDHVKLNRVHVVCKFSENPNSIQKKHVWTFVAHSYTEAYLIMSKEKRRKMSYMYL
jgi:hypothetical protein